MHSQHLPEDVRDCIDFAIDAALALEARGQEIDWGTAEASAKVLRECDVVVRPSVEVPEVIRVAEQGELLVVVRSANTQGFQGYVAVDQDGDVAYVPADCVEFRS